MSRKIENITDLRKEVALLQQRKVELKAELKDDFEDLKHFLNPLTYVPGIISAISGFRIHRGLFTKEGFADELKSILRQLLIRSGTSFFSDKVYGSAFNLFSNFFRKKKKKKDSKEEEDL